MIQEGTDVANRLERKPKRNLSRFRTQLPTLNTNSQGADRPIPFANDVLDPISPGTMSVLLDAGQTLIILDWDDTLCPTSHIWCEEMEWDKPATPAILESLRKHTMAVEALLRFASKLGTVYIVTLAAVPWVSTSIANFMPDLQGLLEELGIKVIYAREAVSDKTLRGMIADESRDVGQVLKTAAMRHVVKRGKWMNAISVGDSDAEFYGIQDAIFHHKGQGQCACKAVKLEDEPDLEVLTVELEVLLRWLPSIIKHGGDLELDFAQLGVASPYTPVSAKSCSF